MGILRNIDRFLYEEVEVVDSSSGIPMESIEIRVCGLKISQQSKTKYDKINTR